ncbi:MAG: ERCC4 domain-containing protein [Anditalea sp.]
MPLIKVDDRECNENLLSALRQEKDTIIRICRLPVGDYQVEDLLLVERKTIRDLFVSIKDGRWFRQAIKLSTLPLQSMVILEGTSVDYQSLGMKREAVQGALVTLSLLFKIPLIRSRTPEETAKLILYAARQIQSFGCHPGPVRHLPFSRRMKDKRKRQIHVLQGLPGIGPVRARLLLEKFGTLKAVFDALTDEWETLPGIGKNTIRQIKQVME